MGIFKGALTVRRYRVEGEIPEDFRDRYPDLLNEHAYREPMSWDIGKEAAGWCLVHNLLDTDFTDRSRWLYNHYLAFALRVDKKALPARLFKAHFDKRVAKWCEDNGKTRVPRAIKQELKEALQQEMLLQTLPSVATTEVCWNVVDGWVFFHATSESANDRFRKLFLATFGLHTEPFSPLDFLADEPDMAHALEAAGISDYRPDSAAAAGEGE